MKTYALAYAEASRTHHYRAGRPVWSFYYHYAIIMVCYRQHRLTHHVNNNVGMDVIINNGRPHAICHVTWRWRQAVGWLVARYHMPSKVMKVNTITAIDARNITSARRLTLAGYGRRGELALLRC